MVAIWRAMNGQPRHHGTTTWRTSEVAQRRIHSAPLCLKPGKLTSGVPSMLSKRAENAFAPQFVNQPWLDQNRECSLPFGNLQFVRDRPVHSLENNSSMVMRKQL